MSVRNCVKTLAAALLALAILAITGLAMTGGALAEGRFPVRVSADHRFFEDASGRPFLMLGDTAWSLIAELKREDVELYLQDRRKRGFNAILVNLLEHQFSSNPPANAYGAKPFDGAAFGTLDAHYFDHAAWVVERAQALGFVVLLVPAYLGANGGGQGWYQEIGAAGPKRMRAYGEAVARRFAGYRNIVWVLGGDFDAPDKMLVSNLAEGVASVLPDAIQTVHTRRNTNTAEVWADARWLGVDTVYDYDDVHGSVLARTMAPAMPVILIEGLYEGEHGTSALTIRRNAYGALLAGAVGQFFGNSPIWHFSGPGVFDRGADWRAALDSPGARAMSVLGQLFDRLPWTGLRPDREQAVAAAPDLYAAALPGGALRVIYGEASGFAVRKAAVKAGDEALWFDPVSGQLTVADRPDADGATLDYRAPASKNAGGDGDWVLLIGEAGQMERIRKR